MALLYYIQVLPHCGELANPTGLHSLLLLSSAIKETVKQQSVHQSATTCMPLLTTTEFFFRIFISKNIIFFSWKVCENVINFASQHYSILAVCKFSHICIICHQEHVKKIMGCMHTWVAWLCWSKVKGNQTVKIKLNLMFKISIKLCVQVLEWCNHTVAPDNVRFTIHTKYCIVKKLVMVLAWQFWAKLSN